MHKSSLQRLVHRLIVTVCGAMALSLALVAGCTSPGRLDTSGMSFSSEPLVGKVVWNDLITEDIEAARRFYGGLFGWTFEDSVAPGRQGYTLARSGNVYVAGLVPVAPRTDGSKLSRWLPYVSVDDVDSAVARATAAGAQVAVGARDLGLGRVAAIIDPEGAVIGLARSSSVGYDVRTIERRGGQYTLLAMRGDDRAGILKNPTDWRPVWLTHFGVDDPAAASARVEALGGKVLAPVSPALREGTMAVVADPSGAILVLQKLSR